MGETEAQKDCGADSDCLLQHLKRTWALAVLLSSRDAAVWASWQRWTQLLPTGTQITSSLQHSAPAPILTSFNGTYVHFQARAGEWSMAEGWTAAERVTQGKRREQPQVKPGEQDCGVDNPHHWETHQK